MQKVGLPAGPVRINLTEKWNEGKLRGLCGRYPCGSGKASDSFLVNLGLNSDGQLTIRGRKLNVGDHFYKPSGAAKHVLIFKGYASSATPRSVG